MADIKSGTASHTSGSDTMAGVPEMPSSMSMSKSQKHNEKKAPSTPGSTSRDTTEFGKHQESGSTSKFKKNGSTPSSSVNKHDSDDDSDDDSDTDSTPKASDQSDNGKRCKPKGFDSAKAQFGQVVETEEAPETEKPKRRGFRRDEYFKRMLETFREQNKPIILDRHYVNQHTEEPVDKTYHKLHKKWEAQEQKRREAFNKDKDKNGDDSNNVDESNNEESSDEDDGESNNSTPLKKATVGFGGKKAVGFGGNKEEKESPEENEEANSDSSEDEEETPKKASRGFGKNKASKEPEKYKRSKEQQDAIDQVQNFGNSKDTSKEPGSDDASSSSSDNDDNKPKRTGGGFGNGRKSQPDGDEDEKENSEASCSDYSDTKSEIDRIKDELDQNRLYSGHICYELEEDEVLHGVNVPGEGLAKIESLQFKVSQGVEGGVKEVPQDHYVTNEFADMNLHYQLAKNIKDYNWGKPLLVQRVAMRPIFEGKDILVNAQTGSGKTGAYLIPIINKILKNEREKQFAKEVERGERSDEIPGVNGIEGINPSALILVPTRELAIQIAREAVKLCRGLKKETIKVCNLYGGTKRTTQRFEAFGADIIVGTPGRVGDILFPGVEGATRQNFENCEYVVLDEADRMLDEGFGPTVLEIIKRTQDKRGKDPIAKVLTSATFPAEIQSFASAVLRDDYLYAQCGVLNAPCASVVQKAILIENRKKKLDKLDEVLEEHNVGEKDSVAKALIFAKTKKGVDFLALKLSEKLGEKCITMHGDRSQVQREIALWTFSTSNCPVLVATNVAARGLDIPAVDLIVNFDCSDECYFNDDYIHRIGRAGRVGRPGTAVTFIDKERDAGKAAILKTLMEGGNAEVPDWLEELATDAPESDDDDKESEAASVSSQLGSRTPSMSNLSVSNHTTPTKKKFSDKPSESVKGVRRG